MKYDSQPARMATGANRWEIEIAVKNANTKFRERCALLEVDTDTIEAAPVMWWLNVTEMETIKQGLDQSDPVGRVLRAQLDGILESIRLMRENNDETG